MVVARYHGQMVFCVDVPATAELYETSLGFQHAYNSDGDISLRAPVADASEATVEIYLHPATEATPTQLGTFIVDDVDASVQDLTSHGWLIATPAFDTPWAVREATATDPNGHTLTLNGPVTDAGNA